MKAQRIWQQPNPDFESAPYYSVDPYQTVVDEEQSIERIESVVLDPFSVFVYRLMNS